MICKAILAGKDIDEAVSEMRNSISPILNVSPAAKKDLLVQQHIESMPAKKHASIQLKKGDRVRV